MAAAGAPGNDIFSSGGPLHLAYFTPNAAAAMREALNQARQTRWDSVRSPHIFMGLLANPDESLRQWGERLGAELTHLLSQFQELFQQDEVDGTHLLLLHREFLSDKVIDLLREAWQRAQQQNRRQVRPMDLLISLLSAPNSIVAECFERIGVSAIRLTELAVLAENDDRPS